MAQLTLIQRRLKYAEAKRKGVQYLLDKMNPDGSIGPVEDGFYFYRLPWTFTVAGETEAALKVCAWVRENMLTPEGDFDRGLRKVTDAYAYRNATFIYGAHMARQYDLSYGCMPFLLSLQDPSSGGFANDMTDHGPSDTMDVPYSVRLRPGMYSDWPPGAGAKGIRLLDEGVGAAGRAPTPAVLQLLEGRSEGGAGVSARRSVVARGCLPRGGETTVDGRRNSFSLPLPPLYG